MAKNKHLTDDERIFIEYRLKENKSIREISIELEKSVSTISREIRKNSIKSNKFAICLPHNRCVNRRNCNIMYLCEDRVNCTRRCSLCKYCNEQCEQYEEEVCYKLFEPPYVCNGCIDETTCVLKKQYYIQKNAREAYRERLVESRKGLNMSEDELLKLDDFVSPLIKQGQSINHIFTNNPDEFNVSESTVRRLVSGGLTTAKNIDMPRVVRFKKRKKKVEHKVDSKCRIGRTYSDFKTFIKTNNVNIVQMDSVIGKVGGKVLLTFLIEACDLLLAFIRDRNTSQSVIDIFDSLYRNLGHELFVKIFGFILTDNGSEFSNPLKLENNSDNVQRCTIYYCDPYSSFQKPNVEVAHEMIRRILPKGTSFNDLNQDDINLMLSHINSYSREKLNDKSPFDAFTFTFGSEVLDKLGVFKVPANEIILKPSLLKK